MSTSNTDYLLSILETIDGVSQLKKDDEEESSKKNETHSFNLEMHEDLKVSKNVIEQH